MKKNKKNKISKFIFIFFIILSFFSSNIQIALAGIIPVDLVDIDADSVLEQIEERYHLNRESIRNMGEGFNVSSNKAAVPQVMLFFNPTDPKPGEKITAEALPIYFSNPKESLYYSWYLRKVYEIGGKIIKCDKTNTPGTDEKKYCDKDGDGKITENDWKIEAMRLIANNDYDTSKATYEPGSNKEKDKDGYQAIWGGDDRDKRWKYFDKNYYLTNSSGNYINEPNNSNHVHCYIHDFQSGENYELVGSSGSTTINCPAGTSAVCVNNEYLNCPTGGGTTLTDYMFCKKLSGEPFCDASTGKAACSSGYAVCATTISDYSCSSLPATQYGSSCHTLFSTYIGNPPTCTTSNSDSQRNICRHLFPLYKDFNNTLDLDEKNKNLKINLDNKKAGDGNFKDDEEAFWKTNPDDADTADNGNKDEANVVGLGLNKFIWNYTPGDKVGVAVEGNSMIPTKHDDSSMMIMWALPKNKCEVSNTSSYTKNIKGYDVKIPTAAMDINDCLKDNLVDPREEGQPQKIDITLNYTPENPVNDPDGETGDVLEVDATTSNTNQELSQLEYDWNIFISPDGSMTPSSSWKSITSNLIKDGLIIGPTKGNNISSLKLKMELGENYSEYFPGGIGYLKVQTIVKEYYSYSSGEEMVREGKNDIIIKINSSNEKIKAYMASVDANGKLIFNSDAGEICLDSENGRRTPLCYVLKNEIIGVELSDSELTNFSWSLNGKPLICNSTISNQCADNKQQNTNFFPITDDPGKNYIVSVTANDPVTGKSLSLSRTFQVIEPDIKINTSDKDIVWPKYLGDYVDLDGNRFADESDLVFQTNEGSLPFMKLEFLPKWIGSYNIDPEKIECKVDGDVIELEAATTKEYTINTSLVVDPDDKVPGDVYNIECQAIFSQPPEIRKALNDLWGISQFETTEKYLSDKVQIEVVAQNETENIGLFKPKKLMASLIQNLPSQFTFLLRIILTIIVIITTTSIVFAFMPNANDYETKRFY